MTSRAPKRRRSRGGAEGATRARPDDIPPAVAAAPRLQDGVNAESKNLPPPWGCLLRRRFLLLLLALAVVGGWLLWPFSGDRAGPLVVYCAPDAAVAEKILRDFEARTGTPVTLHFTERGAGFPGLVEQIIREQDAPAGDVFWDNDLLGTLDLQERGLLQPYQSPGHARRPAAFKAGDGSWTGFAARQRVIIANTAKIGTTPPNLGALLPGSDRSRIAFAKPLRGTTLTHYTALWQLWGGERLQAWHHEWHHGGVRECEVNGAVKDLVAEGTCFAGYTDSDEFFAAKDADQAVTMHPVRLENGKTLVIPNTVAILRGTKRKNAARRLVDFLLSAETELALARSKARLIPLGPVPSEQVPEEVRDLVKWAQESVDLTTFGAARAECLAWLKTEYQP